MAKVIDIHVHFGAPGQNGSPAHGCYWSPAFEKAAAYWAFRLITGTLFKKINYDCAKSTMSAVIDNSTKVDKCVFFALDQVYDEQGHTDLTNWTNLYVDNRTIAGQGLDSPRLWF